MYTFLIINFVISFLAYIMAALTASTMASMGYRTKKTDTKAKLYYRVKLILCLLMPVVNLCILLVFLFVPINTIIKWNLERNNIEERL